MQIPVIDSAQMCVLLASVDKIVRIINRGQVYELVYTIENTLKPALENLQSALVKLYSGSLELLANSSQLFSKNTAAQTMHAILHPGKTASLFSKLDELETKLGREVQACEVGRSADADTRLTDLLRKLDAPLARVDENVCTLLERTDNEERLKILEWISLIPYGKHHGAVKEARTSDTCKWLLEHERFREWEDTSSSVILWLQGSPGAGKTFLTSKVIDHVQSLLKTSNNEGFAFFYCNRNEEERRKPDSILRSYVRQLSTAARHPGDMRKRLRDLCRETREKGSDLDVDTCKEQLLESVNLYPKTTLVLDALDECEPDSRGRLVDTIEFLLARSERPLKVFISSRPDTDIRYQFKSRPNIEVQATDNQADIKKFVNEEIAKHRRWGEMSPPLQEEIVRVLLDRSQGMFQWVYLQIKQILKCTSEEAIRNRLGKLPGDLKAAYDEIYNGIKDKDEHDKALADRAFMWVMCACKSLSSDELLSAIRLDSEKDAVHFASKITESSLLALCNNLLVLDSQREVWRFSHLSVTEYFEDNHWNLRQAHCHAAKVCLKLLIETYRNSNSLDGRDVDCSSEKRQEEAYEILDPKHLLQMYSRHHWITHVQTQEGQEADSMLAGLLKAFLGSPGKSSLQYQRWYRQIVSDGWISTSAFSAISKQEISPENAAILAMCRFSFYTLLSDWWDNAEIELSQTNREGDNLLILAAVAGCRPICETLVNRRIQVNIRTGSYGSALVAAAYWGETEIVEFLVEKGADVNMPLQSGDYGSTLAVAAAGGETEIVEFLVEKGADVNMPLQSGDYGSALAAAAYWGKTKIVEFLVEKGADVNMPLQSGDYGSALAAAAAKGETEIVEFLVEKGADVNMPLQSGDYGSALAAAAYWGKTEIVEFLVEKGADVNMPLQSGDYGSALAAAAYWGKTEIVEFLVEKGADMNMPLQSGDYGSALVAAAYWGWRGCAEILIAAGAKVNLRLEDGPFSTALQASWADVSQEDRERAWWDKRDEESLKRDKAAVAELLLRHGATDEV
ncbi:hypothetical protein QBC46DRAFT_326021 [Diplogelasinospora grovesii]|uniref:NACHT domain-containing protein n=1 Tax=Diplogelasinospora grovesii TaxID=303347 RepID=A0AAN6RXT1_9PEZI|nr:hypothetical protein QBC46DRAFT_326021 [Diplogelasinospora grovesii]